MSYDANNQILVPFQQNSSNLKTKHVDIELQPGEKLDHAKSYQVPQAREPILRNEVERL